MGSTSSTVGFSIAAWVLNYNAQATYTSTTTTQIQADRVAI